MQTQAAVGRRSFLEALLGLVGAGVPSIGGTAPRRILTQHSPLAGFQYHEGERLWPSLRIGQTLTLTREPKNTYDPDAVCVACRGRKLGDFPRQDNAAVSQMMGRGERMTARIASLTEARCPWERVGWRSIWSPAREPWTHT
jgi:hypothetical protein